MYTERFKVAILARYKTLVTRPTRLGQAIRKIRRFYYGAFKSELIKELVQKTREGECNRCGACCRLLVSCPFLGRDSLKLPYCRIYGQLRPANCHVYPFDAIDAEIPGCSYSFKDRT